MNSLNIPFPKPFSDRNSAHGINFWLVEQEVSGAPEFQILVHLKFHNFLNTVDCKIAYCKYILKTSYVQEKHKNPQMDSL